MDDLVFSGIATGRYEMTAAPNVTGNMRRTAAVVNHSEKMPQVLRISPAEVVLLIPVDGRIDIAVDDKHLSCGEGEALLLGRGNYTLADQKPHARVIRLYFSRAAIQICASRLYGKARRLIGLGRVLVWSGTEDGFALELNRLVSLCHAVRFPDVSPEAKASLLLALIEKLAHEDGVDTVFPINRSVSQVMDYIATQRGAACEPERLEAVSGVSMTTLRRGFATCLGVSLTERIREARLDWAHERLSRLDESRSIGALGLACGFRTASSFSKAYMNRFGERPVDTRKRTVYG